MRRALLRSNKKILDLTSLKLTINTELSSGLTMTIPVNNGTYMYDVDWGDGVGVSLSQTGQSQYTYSSEGIYQITISGTFPGPKFIGGSSASMVISVDQWGDVGYSLDQSFAWRNCNKLSYIAEDCEWMNSVITVRDMFYSCNSLNSLPQYLTFDEVITGQTVFEGCKLTSLPEGMTLPNVRNTNGMFIGNNLTSLPSGMNLNHITDGQRMFIGADFTSLPEGMLLTNLNRGDQMFRASYLTDLPSGMTLSKLSNGSRMFEGVTLNTLRYSQLLVDFNNLNTNNNVTFHGGFSKYNSSGQTARNALVSRGWNITDGGLE